MRILILGGTGMLGHTLLTDLSPLHETWATLRGSAADFPALPGVDRTHLIGHINALQIETVEQAIDAARPDVVINGIGMIKQRDPQALPLIDLNARLPHQLAALCAQAHARLIHFSTDCVFSGRKGGYVESDPTDADDLYGKTKALGEVADLRHVLTIRTSLIGRELFTRYGLVEWFLSQQGPVDGYQRAIFSGFTIDAVADLLNEFVLPHPEISGVVHISADPISKYDLLRLVRDAYGRSTEIRPNNLVAIDRSLDSSRFRAATGFVSTPWPDMIARMAASPLPYDEWKPAHATL